MPVNQLVDRDERLYILNVIELLAAIFRGPDSSGWTMLSEKAVPELAARPPKTTGHLTAHIEKLQAAILPMSDSPEIIEDVQSEYVRLFVAGRGGVVAPLYESCYEGDTPAVMGDAALAMQHRLSEAGLEVDLPSNEPPDHLSLELEYLYHLLAHGWAEDRSDLEKQGRAFAGDMLAWGRRFDARLADGHPHAVFAAATRCMVAVLETVRS